MLEVKRHTQFKRDVSRVQKQSKDLSILKKVITMLMEQKKLPFKYKDHKLRGNYQGHRECHLESDWLLIYRIERESLCLVRTGSHSELF